MNCRAGRLQPMSEVRHEEVLQWAGKTHNGAVVFCVRQTYSKTSETHAPADQGGRDETAATTRRQLRLGRESAAASARGK